MSNPFEELPTLDEIRQKIVANNEAILEAERRLMVSRNAHADAYLDMIDDPDPVILGDFVKHYGEEDGPKKMAAWLRGRAKAARVAHTRPSGRATSCDSAETNPFVKALLGLSTPA